MRNGAANVKVQARRARTSGVRRPGFTMIELLVTISIIAILAGLVVGGAALAKRAGRESRIRAELNQLVTAIESYKEVLGQYPPDNPVNPAQAPLFYELMGVVVDMEDDRRANFRTKDRSETINNVEVKRYFGVEGFANAVSAQEFKTKARNVRSFIKLSSKAQYREIGNSAQGEDVEVLVVSAAPWPRGPAATLFPPPIAGAGRETVNPWRYLASSNATNNPNSFDLWAEFVDGRELKVICNWSQDVLVKKRL